MELDFDFPVIFFRKCVLKGIGNKFVNNYPKWDSNIYVK